MVRWTLCAWLVAAISLTQASRAPAPPPQDDEICHTFSIVAMDPDKKEWGIAVATKVPAVGAVVPHAKAGVGAIATQSAANVTYGPRGLEMLAAGKSADEVLKALIDADEGRANRQVGIIDAQGRTAIYSGAKCNGWFGSKSGKYYACQGNLLTGEEVIQAMSSAFEKTKGPLHWRLALALEAGEAAGGDKRGKQSAAILVVRAGSAWGGTSDRYVDLRVDDHEEPIRELLRILEKTRGKRPK